MGTEYPPEWSYVPLSAIATCITSGGTPSRRDADRYFVSDGHPWVKTKELRDCPIRETEESISDAALEDSAAKLLPAGTVLMAMYASPTVGRLGHLRIEAACNQACAAILIDRSVASSRYVFYGLLATRWRFQQIASGSAQQNINARTVRNFLLPLPPLPEQRAITRVLGALDDKIESNASVASRGLEVMTAEFERRFGPGQDASKSVHTLGDVAGVVMGQSPPGVTYSTDPAHGMPMVQGMGVFGERFVEPTTFTSKPTRIVPVGTLLMTVRAPVGSFNVTTDTTCAGRGVAALVTEWPAFVECSLREMATRWKSQAGGTIYPSVNRRQVREAPVVAADRQDLDAFEGFAAPLRERARVLHRESRRLTLIRDALLPRLVSGRIRVPLTDDPDEAVETVLDAV